MNQEEIKQAIRYINIATPTKSFNVDVDDFIHFMFLTEQWLSQENKAIYKLNKIEQIINDVQIDKTITKKLAFNKIKEVIKNE